MKIKFLTLRRSKFYQNLKNIFLYWNSFCIYQWNSYPSNLGQKPIFIFNHIPKCAGTSFNQVLRAWFYLKMDYEPNEIQYPNANELVIESNTFEKAAPDLNRKRPWEIVAGHYHHSRFNLSKRFPGIYENPKVKLITFVRHPLAHHLSMYKFGKKNGHEFVRGLQLSDYMRNDTNFLARALECTLENYKTRIDTYFFVGIVEEYKESVKKLANKLGKLEPKKISILNKTYSHSLYKSLSEEEITLFEKNNKLDYMIYSYCLSKFQSDMA